MLTTLYIVVVLLLFICSALLVKASYSIFLIPQLLSLTLKVIPFCSVFYLEFWPTYIYEQEQTTYFNYASLYLASFYFLHALGIFLYSRLVKGNTIAIKETIFIYKLRRVNLTTFFVRYFPILLLILCWVNIFITGSIPLFSGGYIDRFYYISHTKLWPVIGVFGVITAIIPTLLSFGLLEERRWRRLGSLVLFLFYLVYVVFIGHKFGGILVALLLYFMPIFVIKVIQTGLIPFLMKFVKIGILIFTFFIGLVWYHYSFYSLAEEYGGAFGFILYRIFSLQGHTFWGVINHIDIIEATVNPSLSGIWNGMPNLMRLIGPSWIEATIERGVDFTFGYFAALPYFLGVVGVVLLVLIPMGLCWISDMVVRAIMAKDIVMYFLAVNIFNDWILFTGSGTLSKILSVKSLIVTITFVFLIILRKRIINLQSK